MLHALQFVFRYMTVDWPFHLTFLVFSCSVASGIVIYSYFKAFIMGILGQKNQNGKPKDSEEGEDEEQDENYTSYYFTNSGLWSFVERLSNDENIVKRFSNLFDILVLTIVAV